MWWLFGLALVVVACFSLVLLRGAPYLPTLRPQVTTAFELLELRPGETMLELGCGDGKVLVVAGTKNDAFVGEEHFFDPPLIGRAYVAAVEGH